jgi:hypothetical protein
VVGKVFALAPVASPTPPVNFTRDATGAGTLVFEIPAPAGATTAEVVGVVTPLPGGVVEPLQLTLTAGVFTGSITIGATDVLPANVEVTFNLGLVGESVQTLPVTDKIVGFIAGVADPATNPTIVENAAGGLTISAASSNQWGQGVDDGSLMPTLTVTDSATDAVLGTIPGSGGTLDIAAPGPAQVTITSVAAAGAVDPAGGTITLNNPGIAPPAGGGGIVGAGGGGGGCFIADLLGWW